MSDQSTENQEIPQESSENFKEEASNPGSGDPSGGIAEGHGGDDSATKSEGVAEKPADKSEDAEHKSEGAPGGSSKPGAARENPSAIPTAGGEKLGAKHAGESKIVPDNPKPQGEEKVSSAHGQPDQQTKDNTAQNTGGASSGGDGEGEGKEKLMDKIKDKLHMGGS